MYFAADARLLSDMGAAVTKAEQAAIDRIVLAAREAAGAVRAEEAWREGSAMRAADALDYALSASAASDDEHSA